MLISDIDVVITENGDAGRHDVKRRSVIAEVCFAVSFINRADDNTFIYL